MSSNNPLSPKVSLVIPTLNEFDAVQVIMPQIDRNWIDEIIVVDGGSTDGTIEYFKSIGLQVHSQTKSGYGEAMKLGMDLASGEIIVEFTPDGNSIPEVIPKLIETINGGYDHVVASRYKDDAMSEDDDFITGIGNWLFSIISSALFCHRFTDILVGFRAYRKSIAKKLNLDASGLSWPCQTTLRFTWAGFKVIEISANEPARIGGVRKMRIFYTGIELVHIILREYIIFLRSKMQGRLGHQNESSRLD